MKRSPLSNRPGLVGLTPVFVALATVPFFSTLRANPGGATIRHGDIRIVAGGQTLQIIQSSSRGVIDWNSFSIQSGETTRFVQPGASAATLNRVTGQSLSRIDGSLLANGRVLLLNPNGIVVGRNGVIDTAGFTASTLDISNEDFLAGGDLRFQGNSTAGVVNLGSINAVDGDVFLIAASVLNEGAINAANGTVGLAAGNDVLIAESGSERVFVRGAGTADENSGVINRGTVSANVAELKSYGGNIYGMAVKNEGRVAATAVTREGGQIFLRAGGGRVSSSGQLVAKQSEAGGNVVVDSGNSGETEIGGTVDASGGTGTGGGIVILGSTIDLFEGSLIIADGDAGGGRILVGGGRRGQNPSFMNATDVNVADGAQLDASARVDGDGGEVIVFAADRLNFSGSVASTGGSVGGNGGFVELSGKNEVLIPDLSSRVFLSAASGNAGTLLFDPRNVDIVTGTTGGPTTGFPAGLNEIREDDIISFLENQGNLIIETSGAGGDGDITVLSGVDLEFNGDNTLTFMADRDFVLERGATIRAWEGGSIEVFATRSVDLGRSNGVFSGGGIATETGDITIVGNGAGASNGTFSGVQVFQSNVTTTDGAISITGVGGSVDAAFGESNSGVSIDSSSIIASGIGSITINGTGGSAAAGNGAGVSLGFGNTLSSHDGDFRVTGVGGATGSTVSSGIQSVSGILTTGSGSIVLDGTGGAVNGHGIDLSGAVSATGTGSVSLRGNSQVSTRHGIRLSQTSAIVSTADHESSISLEANSIDLAFGGIQSPGDLIIAPLASNTEINLGSGASDVGLQLDGDEFVLLSDGFRSITIGSGTLTGLTIQIEEVSFSDPVTFLASNSGGEILVNGRITGTDDASIFIDGSGPVGGGGEPSTTYLAADIVTEGNSITIDDDVIVEGTARIDATAGGTVASGADIEIVGTIGGSSVMPNLSILSGTSGEIFLGDVVGAGGQLGEVTLESGRLSLLHDLSAVGDLSITTSQNLRVVSGAAVSSGGDIVMSANREPAAVAGDFSGIEIGGGITASSGMVSLSGRSGGASGKSGVVIESGGSVSGRNGVNLEGYSDSELGFGVDVSGGLLSSDGDIRVESGAGDIVISGSITTSFERDTVLVGSSTGDTRFILPGEVSDFSLAIDGGGGTNIVDFSGSSRYGLGITADQLTSVDRLIGSTISFDEFGGSSFTGGNFTITGESSATYREGTAKMIEIEDFGILTGSAFDDTFIIDAGDGIDFSGELIGSDGDDRFVFLSGSVVGISGRGNSGNGGDVIDYSSLNEPVVVDLGNGTANRLDFFSGIETFIGGSGGNTMMGSSGDDEIVITGNGSGSVTLPGYGDKSGGDYFGEFSSFEFTEQPPETVGFSGFEVVAGVDGDDSFSIEIPRGDTFDGILQGGSGEDYFMLSPGGGVARIEGGTGVDTLDFSRFAAAVAVDVGAQAATQVGSFGSIESIKGGSGTDTLRGTAGADQFLIDRDGGGFLNSGRFDSFERLRGEGGADRFVFQNQAEVESITGGAGTDTFVLDDRNLTGENTYVISGNSISRNPFYLFTEVEFLQFFLGSGDDTVVTSDNGLIQVLNGGGGNDTIDFGTTPVSGRTPFVFGASQVFEMQFENFLLVRDETNNPENINQQSAGTNGNQGVGSLVDQFTNTGGLGEALGNAFGAIAGNAIIAGQASVLQVEGGQVEAPLSLDGFFTVPPQEVIGLLDESLEITAWTELADALGFDGATILVRNDGPYSILLDGVPPNEILPILLESLRFEAGRELFEALEISIVIPITSVDGAVSILAIPVEIDPAILQLLADHLNNEAFSELTSALED